MLRRQPTRIELKPEDKEEVRSRSVARSEVCPSRGSCSGADSLPAQYFAIRKEQQDQSAGQQASGTTNVPAYNPLVCVDLTLCGGRRATGLWNRTHPRSPKLITRLTICSKATKGSLRLQSASG